MPRSGKRSDDERSFGKHGAPLTAYLLLALATLFWAGNALLGRALHQDVGPVTLAFWRWAAAALLVLPFAWRPLRADAALLLRAWPDVLVLSLLGVSSFNTLLYHAAHTTTATNLALIQTTMPAAIVLLDRLLYSQRVSRRQGAGVALAMAGGALVVLRGDVAALGSLDVVAGDLWMSLAVLAYALYSVLLRRRPAVHPLSFVAATFFVGALALLPLYLVEAAVRGAPEPTAPLLAAVLYMAIFPSILSYVFWNRAVAAVGAARTGLFVCLVPVYTAVLAVPLLGEALRVFHLTGFALISAGLWLSAAAGGRPGAGGRPAAGGRPGTRGGRPRGPRGRPAAGGKPPR